MEVLDLNFLNSVINNSFDRSKAVLIPASAFSYPVFMEFLLFLTNCLSLVLIRERRIFRAIIFWDCSMADLMFVKE